MARIDWRGVWSSWVAILIKSRCTLSVSLSFSFIFVEFHKSSKNDLNELIVGLLFEYSAKPMELGKLLFISLSRRSARKSF
jgi:hypothetical protein